MYIRRRNCEHGRIKRANRKSRTTESFNTLLAAPVKLLAIWVSIMLLDFFTDFRFEFAYPCWLFAHTIVDSFRYQTLAFTLFFAFTAMMSDLFCYFLIPTTLIYMLGSSFVWIQLVWQTNRGLYGSTIVLCFVFVYVEIAIRFRDPKTLPFGIDICRPFAAHSVGYPAITLGFVLKSMLSHHLRLRQQRAVEARNITFFSLLEEALPVELRHYWRPDESLSGTKLCLPTSDGSCFSSAATLIPPTRNSFGSTKDRGDSPMLLAMHRKQTPDYDRSESSQSLAASRSSDSTTARSTTTSVLPAEPVQLSDEYRLSHTSEESQRSLLAVAPEEIPSFSSPWPSEQLEVSAISSVCPTASLSSSVSKQATSFPSAKATSSVTPMVSANSCSSSTCSSSSSSSLSSCSSASFCCGSPATLTSHTVTAKGCGDAKSTVSTSPSECAVDKLAVSSPSASSSLCVPSKSITGSKQVSSVGTSAKNVNKDEYTLKLEAEVRQLKSELQSLRALEVELRGQVQQLTAAERTYRAESSQARQECETLQSKLNQLNNRLETDRNSLQAAENQLAEERKQRVALEQQLSSARQHSRKAARKELVSSTASGPPPPPPSQCTTGKGTTAKSVTCVSRGISTSSSSGGDAFVSSCTGGGDACAARVKELEAELHLLSLNLSAKDLQLTALKDSRALHIVNGSNGVDKSASHDDRSKSSSVLNRLGADHSEKEELLSKLRCLQEENRRMTDTLKEEDKMKQELMTAYHSSLREITDLNASLTRKEFQIVELNMRLEGLTPHLCDYLNLQNGPLKYFSNQGPSSGDSYTVGQYHPLRTAQPPDPSSLRHAGSNAKTVGRPPLTNRGLHDSRSARTPPNGLDHSLAVGWFNSKMGYTYPTYGSGFLDGTGVPATERPPCIGDIYSQLTVTNGCGIPPHAFDSSYSGFLTASDNGHPCAKAQLGQSAFFGRPSAATHVSDDFNRFGSSHLDPVYSGGSHSSSISSPFYHQSRQTSTVSNPTTAYPDLTTRLLPMGNAVLNSSLHSSTVSSSPVISNTNISRTLLSPQSLRCDFQSFSTGCTTTTGPSESMMTTVTDPIHSGLLHSPSGLEFSTPDSTPANCSISYLLETMTSTRLCDNTLPISARQQLPHDIFCGANTDRVQQQNTFMSSSSDSVNAFLPVTIFSGGSNALHFLRTSNDMDSAVTQSSDFHPSNESALDSESNLSLCSDSCSTTPTLIPSSSDDV